MTYEELCRWYEPEGYYTDVELILEFRRFGWTKNVFRVPIYDNCPQMGCASWQRKPTRIEREGLRHAFARAIHLLKRRSREELRFHLLGGGFMSDGRLWGTLYEYDHLWDEVADEYVNAYVVVDAACEMEDEEKERLAQ